MRRSSSSVYFRDRWEKSALKCRNSRDFPSRRASARCWTCSPVRRNLVYHAIRKRDPGDGEGCRPRRFDRRDIAVRGGARTTGCGRAHGPSHREHRRRGCRTLDAGGSREAYTTTSTSEAPSREAIATAGGLGQAAAKAARPHRTSRPRGLLQSGELRRLATVEPRESPIWRNKRK